jgi:hypothetical protein
MRCFTFYGVNSSNPKVTDRESRDFMLKIQDLCDLGVLMLCSNFFERIILNCPYFLYGPSEMEGWDKICCASSFVSTHNYF